ncbi:hypothetical protein L3Q65_01145 (plasmid) [Amycolatopsis sp. FU40]|uniref:hypothetical protein n=1 Tax=Amycolatopsis sp. FU40 TaxID=2914159 RepID=UPI001F4349F9|nr:hypothetical protein [Amycolatopsis sp. FU40]UKD50931.1 hypothetical protein L3Q65_01145 [Amycolatopsis sp. FU40]
MPVTTYVTFPGDEDRPRLHHVYDSIDEFAGWLHDEGYRRAASSVVARDRCGDRYGTVSEEVRADWRDLSYFGDVGERELRHDQARLLGVARGIMREWSELAHVAPELDRTWTISEMRDWDFGAAREDPNTDIDGRDWLWVQERVQEWLWAVIPTVSKWDAHELSLASFRAFLSREGA